MIINKVDNLNNGINYDHYKYGINNIFLLSCAHRLGFDTLEVFGTRGGEYTIGLTNLLLT